MKKPLHISIPTPCNEDWNKMTPNTLGSFCNSCSKTVIDFTDKNPAEINSYFIKNQGTKTCGRFRKSQLDSTIIEIPQQILFNQQSQSKIFLLALLICMGTTLFSCSTPQKKQRIEQVILVDSVKTVKSRIDNDHNLTEAIKTNDIFIAPPVILDEIIATKGIVLVEDEIIPIDSIIEVADDLDEPPFLIGEVVSPPISDEIIFGLVHETAPKFESQNSVDGLSDKQIFTKQMATYVNANFETSYLIHLPNGKYRIIINFFINEKGDVEDVQVNTKFEKLKEHIKEIIYQLPKFIPGTQRGLPVKVKYSLPLFFVIE